VDEICVEPALTEGMLEHWYRSWAVPGADSTWGGPVHARVGTPLPSDDLLHPAAHTPAAELLLTPAEAEAALRASGVSRVRVSREYERLPGHLGKRWPNFETEDELAARMHATLTSLAVCAPPLRRPTARPAMPAAPCRARSDCHARPVCVPHDAQAKYADESLLLCSHGGPCSHAYRMMLGPAKARTDLNAGYTALYVFVRERGEWEAPVAADQSHLTESMRVAPDVAAADLAGPNDAAEQQR
jgi:hypothetical protein